MRLKRKATSCSESVAVCPDCSRYPEGGPSKRLTSDAFNPGEPSLRPFRLDGDDELRRLDRPD